MKIWIITAILAVIIIACGIIICKINDRIRDYAYAAFRIAEKKFKSGEGKEKMEYAISNVYYLLIPDKLKLFISEDTFKKLAGKLIQKMFDTVSDFLNDGKLNKK